MPAEYAGGAITLDGSEIADAGWFAADALPQLPPRMSIARRLIAPAAPRTGGEVPLPELLDGTASLLATNAVTWEGGTGVTALYRVGDGRLVSLFAGEAPGFDVTWPRGAMVAGHPTVFWQSGPYAYALSGGMGEAELLDLAQRAVLRPWALFVHPSTKEGAPHG